MKKEINKRKEKILSPQEEAEIKLKKMQLLLTSVIGKRLEDVFGNKLWKKK